MRFGFKQPLVGEKRCVTTLITAAEETNGIIAQYTYGPHTWLVRGNTPKVNELHELTYLLLMEQNIRLPLGQLQDSS